MKAIFDALNIIYDEEEKRGLIWLNVVSLFFTFCAIAGMLLALSAVVVFPLFLAAFGLSARRAADRHPALAGDVPAGDVALAVLYRYGPSRRRPKWRWITVGSVFAAVAWLAVSLLFSWYLANFANYNATYGALGAVVGLMMWMWLSHHRGPGRRASSIPRSSIRPRATPPSGPTRRSARAAPSWPIRSARRRRKPRLVCGSQTRVELRAPHELPSTGACVSV